MFKTLILSLCLLVTGLLVDANTQNYERRMNDMPRITGLNNKAGRIIVIDESDWSVEANEVVTASPDTGFEITELSAGQKLVAFRRDTGEIEAFGNVTAADDPVTVPPLGSSTFVDNMNNATYWDESDLNGMGNFSGGKYVKSGDTWNASIAIYHSGHWQAQGSPVDFVVDFSIDSIVGSPGPLESWFEVTVAEVGKSIQQCRLILEGNGSGGLRWNFIGTGTEFSEDPWGTEGTGNKKVRIRRNTDNTLTVWVWNGSSWEWNGSSDGAVSDTATFESDLAVRFYFSDDPGKYINSSVDKLEVFGGTINYGGGGGEGE